MVKQLFSKQDRSFWIAISIAALVAGILATILIRHATYLALSYVLCIMLLLFSLPHAVKKKPHKKQTNKEKRHDPYRLLPQDKGKIIEFPQGKRK